jgi:SAM-dependent methyltransferase
LDLDSNDFPDEWKNSFDYVICIEVIEHLFDPGKALLKIKKLIKNEGTMIISFPNMAWWKYRLKMLRGYYPEESRIYDMVEHLQNFTLYSFRKLIQEAGFKIIKINPDFGEIPGILKYFPWRITTKLLHKYPNLFGYQIVLAIKNIA